MGLNLNILSTHKADKLKIFKSDLCYLNSAANFKGFFFNLSVFFIIFFTSQPDSKHPPFALTLQNIQIFLNSIFHYSVFKYSKSNIKYSNICSLPTSAHLLPWHFNVKYVELLHRTISTLGVMSFFAFLVVVLFFIFFFGLFNHVHWINWLYWTWFSSRWHFCVISGHCCYSCRAFFRRSTKRKAVKGSLRFATMMAMMMLMMKMMTTTMMTWWYLWCWW